MKKNIMVWVIVIIVLLAAAGIYYLQSQNTQFPAVDDTLNNVDEVGEVERHDDEKYEEETVPDHLNMEGLMELNVDETVPSGGENLTEFSLNVPEGLQISVFAEGFVKPRVLVWDPNNNLVVSDRKAGTVYALPDEDGDGKADEMIKVADGFENPHGLAFRCEGDDCQLYVAETEKVSVFDYDVETFVASNEKQLFELPGGGSHVTRTIQFYDTSEGEKLLISVGSSCNVCEERDWRNAAILSANPDGSDLKIYAKGLRNAVFMTTNPKTGELWVTDMGRDNLGEDLPPDEVNIVEEGGDYGWPYCYGHNVRDPEYKDRDPNPCLDTIGAVIDVMPGHSSPLGLAFFPEKGWPAEYKDDLLVAFHGSHHRQELTGYNVYWYKLDGDGNYEGEAVFLSGWLLKGNNYDGRPAGLLFGENSDLYVSDDGAGMIYKVKVQ